jgi:hypothetical protein
MVVSLSFLFGPSRCQRLPGLRGTPCPASASLIWLLLTSRSDTRRCPFRHKARSPQVGVSTFPASPPDLRASPHDHQSFAILSSLALGLTTPHIRFLFVGSRVRSTLPSDGPSRFRPCVSLQFR